MAKAAKKAPTKTEVLQNIANATDLTKKQVADVLGRAYRGDPQEPRRPRRRRLHASGSAEDREEEGPRATGRKGVKNPFTGELQDRPAKPAYNKVKVRALRSLKEMVAK